MQVEVSVLTLAPWDLSLKAKSGSGTRWRSKVLPVRSMANLLAVTLTDFPKPRRIVRILDRCLETCVLELSLLLSCEAFGQLLHSSDVQFYLYNDGFEPVNFKVKLIRNLGCIDHSD